MTSFLCVNYISVKLLKKKMTNTKYKLGIVLFHRPHTTVFFLTQQ